MGLRKYLKAMNLGNRGLVRARIEIPENNYIFELGVATSSDKNLIRNVLSDEYCEALASVNYQLGLQSKPLLPLNHEFFAVRDNLNDKIFAIDSADNLFDNYNPIEIDNEDFTVNFKPLDWNRCYSDRKYILNMYHDFLNSQNNLSSRKEVKEFYAIDESETGKLIVIDPEHELFNNYEDISYIHDATINYNPVNWNQCSSAEVHDLFELYRDYRILKEDTKQRVLVKKK